LSAVVYDINGREAAECEVVLEAVGDIEQYIFCSSAGVYMKSDQMPHREEDEVDFKSRHKVGQQRCVCAGRVAGRGTTFVWGEGRGGHPCQSKQRPRRVGCGEHCRCRTCV
jgi:hypothetical protein